ncbi:MAG: alpha/beta hydrolase [Opitutaceae bacterium]
MRSPALLRLALFAAAVLPGSAPAAAPAGAPEWVTRAVAAPRVSHHVFRSMAAGGPVSYHLYTPAAHGEDGARRFPVVYWLHGSGGGLPGIPQLARLFDAAITARRLPPCFVVFVNGLPGGMYLDWKDGSVRVESMLIRDLLPHVDATHRTVAARGGRVIEGFSMGGYGAARLGFSYPELFAGVSLLGAGPLQPDFTRTPRAGPKQRDEIYQRVYGGDAAFYLARSPWAIVERQAGRLGDVIVRQAIGDRDETFANNVAFHERMRALGVAHTWSVAPGVGHDPTALIRALGDAFWAFHRTAFGAAAATDGQTP